MFVCLVSLLYGNTTKYEFILFVYNIILYDGYESVC